MSVTLLPNLYTEALRPKAMASEDESSGRSSGSDGVTRAWPHDGIGALRRRGTRELSGGSFSVCTHSEGAGGGGAQLQARRSPQQDPTMWTLTSLPVSGTVGK